MKNILALLVVGILPGYALAMESSTVGSQMSQASVNVINSKVDAGQAALQAQLTALQTQVNNMKACEALGEIYTPGHAGADANGCWSNSSANATGTIVAFNGTSCPTGWSEYTAARGKFLRGIDNGAGSDPDGTRAPGAYQADMFASHVHNMLTYPAAWGSSVTTGWGSQINVVGGQPYSMSWNSYATGGAETRPRNVATLFCVKN